MDDNPTLTKQSRSRSPSPPSQEDRSYPSSPSPVVTSKLGSNGKSPTIGPATISIPITNNEPKTTTTTTVAAVKPIGSPRAGNAKGKTVTIARTSATNPAAAAATTAAAAAAATTNTNSNQYLLRQRASRAARARKGKNGGLLFMVACFAIYIWNMQNGQMGQFYQLDQELRQAALKSEEAIVESLTSTSHVPFSAASIVCFLLLTLQCGIQPILVKFFMPEDLIRSTCVLGQEMAKFIMSISFLLASGNWSEAINEWTWESACLAAGVPAVIFTTQTYLNLMANQVLPPVTFSVLNQTKTLSTAFCCFIIMDKPQSRWQIAALLLLVISALVNQKILPLPCDKKDDDDRENDFERQGSNDELSQDSTWDEVDKRQLFGGVVPALCASFLSGLAGALTQKTLTLHARSPHLFNLELAVFSSLFLLTTLALGSPDSRLIRKKGLLKGWTWKTTIPIATNAFGGILVGLVTKHMGAVVKGFSTIFGMILSGILQQVLLSNRGEQVTWAQFVSGCIGAFSLWMHTANPP
ncbi:unnamed protein product [Cylindrotheca closterium]|uniref:Uncharacterized protein n=1 Tax=Cylindrotheca closterium TaxID=2856 RepID=A0AAD2CD35_9STRA|nr:unnamed protein product [Cylindrotheca closterium]